MQLWHAADRRLCGEDSLPTYVDFGNGLRRKWTRCGSPADQKGNNAMALLLADNTTLVQMQPAYRCGHYPAPLLAWGNATDGEPQRFDNVTSILAEDAYGATVAGLSRLLAGP